MGELPPRHSNSHAAFWLGGKVTQMTAKRIALVTGASSGIGRAVAKALLVDGCRVILAGRNETALGEVAASSHAANVHVLPLDITNFPAVDTFLDQLPPAFREIDLLVNNAGHDIGGRTRFDQGPADDWTNVIETNVSGLIRVTRAVVPGMIARGRGDVINVGSVNALRVIPDMAAYSASKAAVHAFSEWITRRSCEHADPRHRNTAGAHADGYCRTPLSRRPGTCRNLLREFRHGASAR